MPIVRHNAVYFLLLSVVGLIVWAADVFLVGSSDAQETLLALPFSFNGLPLLVFSALAAGYVRPKYFWLWGIAVVLTQAIADAISRVITLYRVDRGEISSMEIGGLLLVAAIIAVVFVLICSMGAALGAAIKLVSTRNE